MKAFSNRIFSIQQRLQLKQDVAKPSGQVKAGKLAADPLDLNALEKWSTSGSTPRDADKVIYLHKGSRGDIVSVHKHSMAAGFVARLRRSPENAKTQFKLRAHAAFQQRIDTLGEVAKTSLNIQLNHFLVSTDITLADVRSMQQSIKQWEHKEAVAREPLAHQVSGETEPSATPLADQPQGTR